MNRKLVWLHIALWAGLYIFWVVLFQDRVLTLTRTLTVQFCYLLFISANFYLQVYMGIPRLLYRKRYLAFMLVLLGGIVISALLRVPLAMYLQGHFFRPGLPLPAFGSLFGASLLNIFIWVVCILAAWLIAEKVRFRKYIDAIEKEKTRNELDFLKAQFNPHFLFNSINAIYGHIDRKNTDARRMLLSFSEMLRYQLYECNVDNIGIDKEIRYIRNYVALQQTRKEETLRVCLDIPENIKGFVIAPLLFTTFIENAFKYVSNHENGDNRVEISLLRKGDVLMFRSFNTKDHRGIGFGGRDHRPYSGIVRRGNDIRMESRAPENGMEYRETGSGADRGEIGGDRGGIWSGLDHGGIGDRMDHGGIGMANVRRRLDLQYPGRYELLTRDGEDSYEIILNLQIGIHAT